MESLWADLLNSDWHDHRGSGAREDRLDNEAWLGAFLARTGWGSGPPPGREGRKALRELRALLRPLLDRYRTTGKLRPADVATLNRLLAAAPVVRRLDGAGRLSPMPVAGSLPHLLAEVVASLAEMIAKGEPERVKVCANPDCSWVIYDESRNRTRRWCSATDCGNLSRVRAHRAKAGKD